MGNSMAHTISESTSEHLCDLGARFHDFYRPEKSFKRSGGSETMVDKIVALLDGYL